MAYIGMMKIIEDVVILAKKILKYWNKLNHNINYNLYYINLNGLKIKLSGMIKKSSCSILLIIRMFRVQNILSL